MKAFKLFMVVISVTTFAFMSSCKKPDTTTGNNQPFTLQLKAKYGNQSFALNSANLDAHGRYVVMSNLMFYLSHITLLKTDSTRVTLADAAIFNFSDSTTLSITVNNVTGNFTGISFGCGLDSVQNNNNPLNYAIPSPYSADYNMYWDMMKYRFEVLEGKWDTAVMPIMRNSLVYHIGTNPAYRLTQVNKNFTVCCNTPYTLTLNLDVAQIFYNTTTNETLDISTEPSTSSAVTDNPAVLTTFVDNFSKAFSF